MANHSEEQARLAHEARLARAQKLIEQFTPVRGNPLTTVEEKKEGADTSKRAAREPSEKGAVR